jgi:hypothetical protein
MGYLQAAAAVVVRVTGVRPVVVAAVVTASVAAGEARLRP